MNKRVKKTIWLFIIIILLITFCIWVNSRWKAWFYNPEEKPYTALQAPGRIMLTFGNDNALSRNISWQYDSIVHPDSYVELADCERQDTCRIPATGEAFQSRNGKMVYYVARLRDLRKATDYSYRVHNGAKSSEWHSFATHNAATDDYSFIFIGDVQDTLKGKTNLLLRSALQRHPKTEFLVCGGDLTERPIDYHWQETFDGLDSISQSMPILNVTGNHDYLKYIIRKLERRFSLIFSYFLDSAMGENQVYTLRYNDMQIFCLDSNREFFYLWTQKKWLENALKNSDAKWKIVVLHHPLYSVKGKSRHKTQQKLFDPLIREYGVDLVMQGHEHTYARMTNKTSENTPATPVYTISHCSPKNYNIKPNAKMDVQDFDGRYYQIVRIHGDTLSMSTYNVYDHSLTDSLDIVHNANGKTILDRIDKILE